MARNDVHMFARSITDTFECVSCTLAKTRKARIESSPRNRRNFYEKVYYDLSGPLSPTIGEKTFAAQLIDLRIAKSDVKIISNKAAIPLSFKHKSDVCLNDGGERTLKAKMDFHDRESRSWKALSTPKDSRYVALDATGPRKTCHKTWKTFAQKWVSPYIYRQTIPGRKWSC